MSSRNSNVIVSGFILFFAIFVVQAQTVDKASNIVTSAIDSAGGSSTWQHNGNIVVRETQIRYEDEGIVEVNLTHTMSTTKKGYRIELLKLGKKFFYGWDGKEFWATVDGKPGDHDLINEAKRVVSNAYFRFSLPFILSDDEQKPEFIGSDNVNGLVTNVIKIVYEKGITNQYFSQSKKQHEAKTEQGENSGGHGHGHGHGHEIYNFHFNQQHQLVKVYFSHHGDGTYETILLDDFKVVGGINREHKRTLFRPDGKIHYVSSFTNMVFVKEIDATLFSKP